VLAGELFPAPPSQERSRRARESLLVAALARFAENGYEATTVDEITKHAGVAVGGFYLHFRSKRQVLLVLMDRLLQELDTRPVMARQDDVTTLTERLRAGLQIDWSYAGVYRAWREAALGDASLAALHTEIEAWTATRIAAAVRAATAAPGTRRHIDVAAFSWILSVVFWRSIEAPVTDRERVADTIVAFTRHILFEDGALQARDP
jgi:AcrR family transcriptional regulator